MSFFLLNLLSVSFFTLLHMFWMYLCLCVV